MGEGGGDLGKRIGERGEIGKTENYSVSTNFHLEQSRLLDMFFWTQVEREEGGASEAGEKNMNQTKRESKQRLV